MSQSNLPNAASTASAIAAAATARQFQQLQANAAAAAAAVSTAAVTDSLVTNAFDLIGGTQAAQQFINQIDLYAQQQRRQQQQQQQQQQHQQQQQKQLEQLFNSNFNNNNNHNNNNNNNHHYKHDTNPLSPRHHNSNHNNQNTASHHQQTQQQQQQYQQQQQLQQQHAYQHHPQSSLSSSSTSTASSSSSPPSSNYNFQQIMAQNHHQQQQQQQQHHHNQHHQQQLLQQTSSPHLNKQHSITSSILSLSSASASSLAGTTLTAAGVKSSPSIVQQRNNASSIPMPPPSPTSLSSPKLSQSPTNLKTAALLASISNHSQLNRQNSQLTLNGILSTIQQHQSNHSNNINNNVNNNNNNQQQQMESQQQQQQQQKHPKLYQMEAAAVGGANVSATTTTAQQQQQQQQQQSCPTSIAQTTSMSSALNSMPTAISRTSTSSPTAIAGVNSSQQLQQQHPQQHHQHGSGGAASYKSSWCYGESTYSGVEIEIENNNNNNHIHPGETTYHMKILVPAVASGAIIGKGGETIASLQKDTGARVKMSKSHDFYPGTTERVCLITGSPDGIMSVLDFIMDKIREKPDLTTKIIENDSKQTQERDKQVKILVPNSTAGMIIGKGGAYIKQIKEESGSYVQISQKPKDISLQERCITIIGDKENNKNACKMILSKIVEDPQSGTVLNVSYADISGPVANFNPTGSPYATNQNAINSSTASLNSTLGTAIGGAATAAGLLVNGTGINLSLNLGAPNPAPNLAVATQLLEHIKVAMRGSGYSETATTEVCAALGVLAKYGVLGMGVGVPHAANGTLGSYLGVSALDQQTAAAANAATASNVFGAVGQVNLEQYTAAAAAAAAAAAQRPTQSQLDAAAAAAQFDPFRHLGQQATTPVSLNNNSFGLTAATGSAGATNAQTLSAASLGLSKSPTPGDLGAKDTKNVEIPEVIVGAILGPNGRSLVEIQHISGANVQISKKGIFAPGTRNRIVTITGQPSAIAKAQFLIEQKINDEESKRARQIPLTTVVN